MLYWFFACSNPDPIVEKEVPALDLSVALDEEEVRLGVIEEEIGRFGSRVLASELAPDLHGAVHIVVREHIHAGQVSGFDHRHLQPPGGDDSRLVLVLHRLRLGLRLARDVDHQPAARFVGLASVGSVEVECFLAAPLLFLEAIVE